MQLNDLDHIIYDLREKPVMLDRDLAHLYGINNKRLSEQIRRNKNKFPGDFMMLVTTDEIDILRAQNASANISKKSRSLPRVFTEHGILMLSNVLNSDIADQVSIQIIRTFNQMRRHHSKLNLIKEKITQMEETYDSHFRVVFEAIHHMFEIETTNKRVGFFPK